MNGGYRSELLEGVKADFSLSAGTECVKRGSIFAEFEMWIITTSITVICTAKSIDEGTRPPKQ